MILMALRTLLASKRSEKLLYINVLGFGVAALIALYIPSQFGFIVAATFFICSTISANAIAYTLKRIDKEIIKE